MFSETTHEKSGSFEDDYPYDGEREDSDIESSSNSPSARKYKDTELPPPVDKKPKTPISVNLKSPAKLSTQMSKPVAKKIDLGAAANYGKDVNINSPTHKNTHSEESVVSPNNNTSNDLLDDLFKTCPVSNLVENDDFNPRASEQQTSNGEFGDFSQAFSQTKPAPSTDLLNDVSPKDEFADFSSAFVASPASQQKQPNLMTHNLLLQPAPGFTGNAVNSADLLSTDLGGLSMNDSGFNMSGKCFNIPSY